MDTVSVQRYYRPEDVGEAEETTADFWELYSSDRLRDICPSDIIGKCHVRCHRSEGTVRYSTSVCITSFYGSLQGEDSDTFVCTKRVEFGIDGKIKVIPRETDRTDSEEEAQKKSDPVVCPRHLKASSECPGTKRGVLEALKTLDIFAGCGGLSEGMHQAGIADTKWAIEYDDAAAEAFKLNHPFAAMLCNNVSALLCRTMSVHGHQSDCCSCEEVQKQAAIISEEDILRMPLPGEVEFIMGGPPCQGYSGMNRFNRGQWSMVQNSMVTMHLALLTFTEQLLPCR